MHSYVILFQLLWTQCCAFGGVYKTIVFVSNTVDGEDAKHERHKEKATAVVRSRIATAKHFYSEEDRGTARKSVYPEGSDVQI